MRMDIHTATEESYKNGYQKGYSDAKKEMELMRRKGFWNTKNGVTFCSICMTCGSAHWKVCPVCEAKMEE